MKPLADLFKSLTPLRLIKWACLGFVFWIGWLILTPFPHYLPPDFEFGFLRNKGDFFYRSGYFIGFYAHIIAAPLGLFVGGLQMGRTIRDRYPVLHRRCGQVYVVVVLAAAAPGGLIMAMKAYGGWSTTICFSVIAIGTWWSTLLGWRSGRRCDFARHRIWMMRSYVLMLSAVFLRLGHIALQPLELSHRSTYQLAAWLSWTIPILVLEIVAAFVFRWRPHR